MSEPIHQVTNAARGVSWNIIALVLVLPVLFALLIWQLWGLDPEPLCRLVQNSPGDPPGSSCFDIIKQVLSIKGWAIYGLLGTIALFTVICIVAAVKAVMSLVGPGNLKIDLRTEGNKDAE